MDPVSSPKDTHKAPFLNPDSHTAIARAPLGDLQLHCLALPHQASVVNRPRPQAAQAQTPFKVPDCSAIVPSQHLALLGLPFFTPLSLGAPGWPWISYDQTHARSLTPRSITPLARNLPFPRPIHPYEGAGPLCLRLPPHRPRPRGLCSYARERATRARAILDAAAGP